MVLLTVLSRVPSEYGLPRQENNAEPTIRLNQYHDPNLRAEFIPILKVDKVEFEEIIFIYIDGRTNVCKSMFC